MKLKKTCNKLYPSILEAGKFYTSTIVQNTSTIEFQIIYPVFPKFHILQNVHDPHYIIISIESLVLDRPQP